MGKILLKYNKFWGVIFIEIIKKKLWGWGGGGGETYFISYVTIFIKIIHKKSSLYVQIIISLSQHPPIFQYFH